MAAFIIFMSPDRAVVSVGHLCIWLFEHCIVLHRFSFLPAAKLAGLPGKLTL